MSGSTSALVGPGAIVAGRYKLDALIGEGGMGAVWSATHLGLGQAIAIKFVSKEFVSSQEALRRFDAEAKAAAQLRSRHVVQVFDNGALDDGTPYIAMELLHGETLSARVQRGGPVPLKEAVEILSQSCKALGRAHAVGIVHRDIKPDNIFLAHSHDDDSYVVKILDFGIAKFAGGPNDHGTTRTGAVLGTPLFMSPEQARGLKSVDYRTDLYSLGLVAYTILTGNLAFSSESFGDLLLQICTSPLPNICANASWLPPTMDAWFQRACARDPNSRYASAQDLADALRIAAQTTLPVRGPLSEAESEVQGTAPAASALALASSGTPSGMSRSEIAPPKERAPLVFAVAAGLTLLSGAVLVTVLLVPWRGGRAPAAAVSAASMAPSSVPGPAMTEAGAAVGPTLEPASSASSAAPGSANESASEHAPHATPPRPPQQTSGHGRPATPAALPTIDLGY